ncbi:hypothetical protein E4U22_001591 [Claviceps purpurea]|nr:hypothetical protein E4U22_001591 [Claviceps purpurea]
MSLPEQQDLEGNLQNLTLNSPPPTDQPGSSAPPQEEELDLEAEEQLHPSLERYRKYISPAWKDVTEESDVEDVTETNDYIIYHLNYYVQHGSVINSATTSMDGRRTTTIWENASTPIRPYARDFLLDNGVTLDPNVRKIGDKLVALVQQTQATLTTAYLDSLKGSSSPLGLNNLANRTTTPLSFRTAVHMATQQPDSVHPSAHPSIHGTSAYISAANASTSAYASANHAPAHQPPGLTATRPPLTQLSYTPAGPPAPGPPALGPPAPGPPAPESQG